MPIDTQAAVERPQTTSAKSDENDRLTEASNSAPLSSGSNRKKKRRIAPTLVAVASTRAQKSGGPSRNLTDRKDLEERDAVSPRKLDASLGSLCVFVATSLARFLETDGLPLRNVQRYCDVVEAIVGATDFMQQETKVQERKPLNQSASSSKMDTSTSWREDVLFILIGILVQSSITHVSVVRRLMALAVAISPTARMSSTLLTSSLAACVRRVSKWNEIRMMSSHAESKFMSNNGMRSDRAGCGATQLATSDRQRAIAAALEKEAAISAAAQALTRGIEGSGHSSAAYDRHWQLSADRWLLSPAFEKRRQAAALSADSEAKRAAETPDNETSTTEGGEDLDQDVVDERRAALQRVTAAARANGLVIAREFQKLQRAYNRGFEGGDNSDVDSGSDDDDAEKDGDYGGSRRRRRRRCSSRRSGRNGAGNDSTKGHDVSGGGAQDEEVLEAELRAGRYSAWKFCKQRMLFVQRTEAQHSSNLKTPLHESFKELSRSGIVIKLPLSSALSTVPPWESDTCIASASTVLDTMDAESTNGDDRVVPPLPLILPTPSVWAAVLAVTLSKVHRLFSASTTSGLESSESPREKSRRFDTSALETFFATKGNSDGGAMDAVEMSASAAALAAHEESMELGKAVAFSALALWRPLLEQLRRLVAPPVPVPADQQGDSSKRTLEHQEAAGEGSTSEARDMAASGSGVVADPTEPSDDPFKFEVLPSPAWLLPSTAKAKLVACFEKLASSTRVVASKLRRQSSTANLSGGAKFPSAVGSKSFGDRANHLDAILQQVDSAIQGGASLSGIALLVCLLEMGRNSEEAEGAAARTAEVAASETTAGAGLRFWCHWLESERSSTYTTPDSHRGSSTSERASTAAHSSGEVGGSSAIDGLRRAPEAIYQSDLLLAELVQLRLTMMETPEDFEDAPRGVAAFFELDDARQVVGAGQELDSHAAAAALVDWSARAFLLRRLAEAMEAFVWEERLHLPTKSGNAESAESHQEALRAGSAYLETQSGRGIGAGDENPQWKKRRKKRLRSRNRVIDDWLGDEDGNDAYADLEDFIVS